MSAKEPFWRTLPAVLTGLAALVGAIGTLVVGLSQAGLLGKGNSPTPPAPSGSATPAADPAAAEFRIVELQLRADPFQYRGPCPVRIEFSGRISVAGGGGTVSFKFLRDDGASAPVQTVAFAGPGSQSVTTTWQLGAAGWTRQGWQQIQTFDPQERTSPRAEFSIQCQ